MLEASLLPPNIFAGLSSLGALSLEFNRFSILGRIFSAQSPLPQLYNLILNNVRLTRLNKDTFATMTNLRAHSLP